MLNCDFERLDRVIGEKAVLKKGDSTTHLKVMCTRGAMRSQKQTFVVALLEASSTSGGNTGNLWFAGTYFIMEVHSSTKWRWGRVSILRFGTRVFLKYSFKSQEWRINE